MPWPLLRTLAAEGRLLLSLEFPTKLAHHVLTNVLALKFTLHRICHPGKAKVMDVRIFDDF